MLIDAYVKATQFLDKSKVPFPCDEDNVYDENVLVGTVNADPIDR